MNNPGKNAEEFSALRSFLRGYLHEDWRQEYTSVEEAARDFWEDADADERERVRAQWLAFTKSVKDLPLDKVARRLQEFGSAWRPQNEGDLEAITRALSTSQ